MLALARLSGGLCAPISFCFLKYWYYLLVIGDVYGHQWDQPPSASRHTGTAGRTEVRREMRQGKRPSSFADHLPYLLVKVTFLLVIQVKLADQFCICLIQLIHSVLILP